MVITLLTDFGFSDPYVGVMKGVILNINSETRIVDIMHNVSPQNIDEAAFVLKSAYRFFPEGTIHVVVVDPCVGSNRAVLAVKTDSYIFLAPDNGVLKYVFDDYSDAEVYCIINKDYFLHDISRTFHGRDIFAPVAAHLSLGVPVEKMGELFSGYVKGEIRKPVVSKKKICGEIVYIDRFGNGVTNIDGILLRNRGSFKVYLKGFIIDKLSQTYINVPEGELLICIGSIRTLEISVNKGSAKGKMDLRVGDEVIVDFLDKEGLGNEKH